MMPGEGSQRPAADAAAAGPGVTASAGSVAADLALAELVKARVRDIADYPQSGVMFKDITPLLGDGDALAAVVNGLAAGHARRGALAGVDKVVGIEARGFILAASVAIQLGAGFVPVRKQGKLPGPTFARSYELEYGNATIEVHQDAFAPGERVLVVDDVLATGGTAAATVELVRTAGAEVTGISVILELSFLGGRARLPGDLVRSLLVV